MLRSRIVMLLVGAAILVGAPALAQEKPAERSTDVSVQDLAFLAGCWMGSAGEDKLQECWAGPEGNSMIGGFRWIKGGKLWMYEVIVLVDDGEEVMFRLRHFDAEGNAWEDKDAPISARLELVEGSRAVFKDVNEAGRRITYEIGEDGALHISIESEKDGKPQTRAFTFTRMQ